MNTVNLMGRICRDPIIRDVVGTGRKYAHFTLRVDRRFSGEGGPEADYFGICAKGKQAEFCENYLHEGMRIGVTGELQNNNYTNAKGVEVKSIKVLAHSFDFADYKKEPLASMGAALSYAWK